jgi:o-succinylbenzoate---CoA ligase
MPDGTDRAATRPGASAGQWVPEWLGRQAAAHPGRLALGAGSLQWSFQDLDRHAARVARQLAGLGVADGTRVALLLRNGASFVVLTHALLRVGAIMIPLNVRLAAPEIVWQLADSNAEVLVSDTRTAQLATDAARGRPGLRRFTIEDPPALLAAPEAGVALRDAVDLSAVQGVVYTSATAGRPKGVQLTYGNHWWSAVGSAFRVGLRDDDRWLTPLPFYHVGGLATTWRSVIYGTSLLVHDAFDPRAVNDEIDAGGATIVSVVSTMLERMLDARGPRPYPPTLRCVLLGGGPAPSALMAACAARAIPVAPTYGLTEAASQVATLVPGEVPHRPGSSGQALLPTQMAIDRNGRTAAAGEVGEIIVRGPTVMLGYAGQPDETARALRGGWLRTGDLGYLDREGYLYVVDRRDDLIVTGGENVYPAEVEAVLRQHPAIADAGVVGLPDHTWGHAVTAFVVADRAARLEEDEVKAFCRDRLARYKVPQRVRFVDRLPRSDAGKLLRRQIREWVQTRGTPAP